MWFCAIQSGYGQPHAILLDLPEVHSASWPCGVFYFIIFLHIYGF